MGYPGFDTSANRPALIMLRLKVELRLMISPYGAAACGPDHLTAEEEALNRINHYIPFFFGNFLCRFGHRKGGIIHQISTFRIVPGQNPQSLI
jgi:hypothetical protein